MSRVRSWWREMRTFVSTYRRVLSTLGVLALITFPTWWAFDATWSSVMTNIFATIVATPVIIFGVDGAFRRVDQRRRAPRDRAVVREFRIALGKMVVDVVRAAGVEVQLDSRSVTAAAEYAREQYADLAARLRAIRGEEPTQRVIHGLLGEFEPIERALNLGDDALSPEQIAFGLRAVRQIEDALGFSIRLDETDFHSPKPQGDGGRMWDEFSANTAALVSDAATVYLALPTDAAEIAGGG